MEVGWALGYVELAKGRFDRARQIFESLENALEDDESPILEVVQAGARIARCS